MSSMTLTEYIKGIVMQFSVAEGNEVPGIRTIDFELGIRYKFVDGKAVAAVDDSSANRIAFSLEVGRK